MPTSPSHPSCALLSLLLLSQCAQRVIRWLTVDSMDQEWAQWAHAQLLPRLASLKSEFERLQAVQAKVKATQKVAGQYRIAHAHLHLAACLPCRMPACLL